MGCTYLSKILTSNNNFHSDARFFSQFFSVGNKIYKITKLFDRVIQLKNQGITYWAKRNRLMVVWIISELKKTW